MCIKITFQTYPFKFSAKNLFLQFLCSWQTARLYLRYQFFMLMVPIPLCVTINLLYDLDKLTPLHPTQIKEVALLGPFWF